MTGPKMLLMGVDLRIMLVDQSMLTSSPATPSEAEVVSEKLNTLGAVHFEPVGTN